MTTTDLHELSDFHLGQPVRHRQWTVPTDPAQPQEPIIHRPMGFVREVRGESVWVYFPARGRREEFLACELIPAVCAS